MEPKASVTKRARPDRFAFLLPIAAVSRAVRASYMRRRRSENSLTEEAIARRRNEEKAQERGYNVHHVIYIHRIVRAQVVKSFSFMVGS